MGWDIHAHVERRGADGRWEKVPDQEPFDWRNDDVFDFLNGNGNIIIPGVPPIVEARGVPEDASPAVRADHEAWDTDAFSASWLAVQELAAFDYDRQVTVPWLHRIGDDGRTEAFGENVVMTFREFLGDRYLREVEELKALGDPTVFRVVYWFSC